MIRDEYPEIQDIGPIPYMGDTYYDGILDAHSNEYFITQSGDEITGEDSRDYEVIFFVYPMDNYFRYLLDVEVTDDIPKDKFFPREDGYEPADLPGSDYCSFRHALLMEARAHAARMKPIGYFLERNIRYR